MEYHLNQMNLLKNLDEYIRENPKKVFFISFALFLVLFIPSMIFMFYVSKDTSENPLNQNINFYNLTYFPLDNRIKPDINLISWIDENSLDCNNIHELITVQNKSLDEIFTLNTRYINYLAKSLIAIQFVMLFFIMIFFFANLQQFGIDSVSVDSDGSVGSTIVSILLICF